MAKQGVNGKSKKKATISEIIKLLVLEYGEHPYDINCGNCEDFADDLEKRVDGVEVYWGDSLPQFFNTTWHDPEYHAFVKHNDKYYDAEEPYGVKTPDQLPVFLRQKALYDEKQKEAIGTA